MKSLTQDYLNLADAFYSEIEPEPIEDAKLVIQNQLLLDQMNCDLDAKEIQDLVSGQLKLTKVRPLAQKYVGHQFGYFNPDLGDGRGLLLGQWEDQLGNNWDFHLKGAGRTPYSRGGDGRAVLRSTIREFLASEALAGLGIPSTRALAIAMGDETVQRETIEPRASLIRVAQTHIRFGHFEWAAMQGKQTFFELLNFVVLKHFPQWEEESNSSKAQNLFDYACVQTAKMIAKWQAFGFNHGVMNTDNMSILGETFDYGPYAFFDDFDSKFICNHSDHEGRYGYSRQAQIGLWNCQVLASSFATVAESSALEQSLQHYVEVYNQSYLQEMIKRLGLTEIQTGDQDIIGDLLLLMDKYSVDYNLFFRRLEKRHQPDESELMGLLSNEKAFMGWWARFDNRLKQNDLSETTWRNAIQQHNPSVTLRNYIAQDIIAKAEAGNYEMLKQWMLALQSPFDAHDALKEYQQPPEVFNKGFRLSCSS